MCNGMHLDFSLPMLIVWDRSVMYDSRHFSASPDIPNVSFIHTPLIPCPISKCPFLSALRQGGGTVWFFQAVMWSKINATCFCTLGNTYLTSTLFVVT